MARPRKPDTEKKRHMVTLRFSDSELAQLRQLAKDAGVPPYTYVRETVLGRRPKAKPAQMLIYNKVLYELQSIATNCRQLADATGDALYKEWARLVGGQFPDELLGQADLSDTIDGQIASLNQAGQQINSLARKANQERPVKANERAAAFRALKRALEPIRQSLQAKKKKQILHYPAEA